MQQMRWPVVVLWLCAAAHVLLVSVCGAALARWLQVSSWGPEIGSANLLACTLGVVGLGIVLVVSGVWVCARHGRAARWGLALASVSLIGSAGVLLLFLGFTNAWGP